MAFKTKSAVLAASAIMMVRPAYGQVIGSFFDPVPITVGGAPGDTTSSRAAGLYDAPGLTLGNFTVRPNLNEIFGYNSSVLATPNGSGSTFVNSRFTTDVTSNWARNSVFLSTDVNDQRYLALPGQDFTEWSVRTGGMLDIGSDMASLNYSHFSLFEQPGALDAVTIVEPVPFRLDTAQLSYAATNFGPFTFMPELTVTNYSFSDFAAGGRVISQAYRNRLATQGELTTLYELSPQRDVLFVIRGVHLSYSSGTAAAPKRNSDGGAILTGLDYPASDSNFRFRVLAGVQARQYVSKAYANQLDPIVEASVIWTPTRLTTVTLLARRDIEDAQDENIASYVASSARVSAAHELRRNIRLFGYVEVEQASYQSANIQVAGPTVNLAGRSDLITRTSASVTWLLSRNVQAALNYGVSRGSSGGGSTYVSNNASLGLNFRW